MRRLFLAYLVVVAGVAVVGLADPLGRSGLFSGAWALLAAVVAASPWSLAALFLQSNFASDLHVSREVWYRVFWGCIAFNLVILAYFGRLKPRRR